MYGRAGFHGILLVGGCAGVGKTTVARAFEEQEGLRRFSVDDRVGALRDQRLAQLGIGDDWTVPASDVCARLITRGRVLEPHLERWVRQLMDAGRPAVLEGEGIQPGWAAALSEELPIRAVFIVEQDGEQIWNTGFDRSSSFRRLPEAQRRNVVSTFVLYSQWIQREAEAHDQPWVTSRPWKTLPDRVLDAIAAISGRRQ